jgi:hypothetical protein
VFTRVRSPGAVEVFEFNSATGGLGVTPLFRIPVTDLLGFTFFGIDQVAVHLSGAKLYVSESGVLNVYHTRTGTLLRSITAPNIVEPTGVCLAPEQETGEDDDNDGIVDAADRCLFTAPSEVIDQTGCSVADLCPCENDWKNHRTYVRCVAHATADFRVTGLMTEAEQEAVVATAGNSACGKKSKKPKKLN